MISKIFCLFVWLCRFWIRSDLIWVFRWGEFQLISASAREESQCYPTEVHLTQIRQEFIDQSILVTSILLAVSKNQCEYIRQSKSTYPWETLHFWRSGVSRNTRFHNISDTFRWLRANVCEYRQAYSRYFRWKYTDIANGVVLQTRWQKQTMAAVLHWAENTWTVSGLLIKKINSPVTANVIIRC